MALLSGMTARHTSKQSVCPHEAACKLSKDSEVGVGVRLIMEANNLQIDPTGYALEVTPYAFFKGYLLQ